MSLGIENEVCGNIGLTFFLFSVCFSLLLYKY